MGCDLGRKELECASVENVRRLAKSFRLPNNVDKMSHNQLIRFVLWYFRKVANREKGLY